jgi:general nucleoside transport system permease protein
MQRWHPIWVAVGALGATAIFAAGSLWLGGFDPLTAAGALVRGSVGSTTALFITMTRAVPLILTGLAVSLAFRAGVWNIGAEGQLYAGAIAAVSVGIAGVGLPALLLVPLVLGAAALAGAAWAALPAFMRVRLGVGEVITTILMNFVGIYLAAYVVSGPLQEARGVFQQTDPIAEAARLPMLGSGTRLHMGFALAIGVAIALWALFRWTRVGFKIRAVGAAPTAARIAGMIPANRVILVSFVASGAIAGLAGGVEVAGVTYALYPNLSPGWGYTAIAVALLAGLHPLAIVGTGLLFGALESGAAAMQREAGIPQAWVSAVVALVILSVLAADQIRRRRADD